MTTVFKAFAKLSDVAKVRMAVSLALLGVYGATLAPSVTLWDAGEFQAATAALGIPHPPGTPLFILLANAWAKVLGSVPFSIALNLLSAVSTAIACGLLGGLITRWTGDRLAGIASGITAGTMLAVWLNATETEIYAVSMLLGVLMVVVGDRAGALNSARHRFMLAYLMGLAIPVQISALVAAPPAIVLAAMSPGSSRPSMRHLLSLGGVMAIVVALSQNSIGLAVVGTVAVLATVAWKNAGSRLEGVGFLLIAGIGLSATLFMLVRAAHDPFINQGNPSSFSAMMDVVTRQQYPLPGMWPRRAPVWIQLLNLVQYADWQVASGLDASVSASWWRTPWSVLALALLVPGARWHMGRNRRGAIGIGLLLAAATLGVVVVLNHGAGPSILDRVLPPGALHEPRERDYFYALGFATAGVWIGVGAVHLARRSLVSRPRLVAPVALGIAALPTLLNWNAATRRPDGMIASTLGEALLASVPPRALLLLAGDNDSYTVWYRQSVLGERRDVVPITIPLLAATWYREEQRRRHNLLAPSVVRSWIGEQATTQALVAGAIREGRPVAASISISPSRREPLSASWALGGMAYVAGGESGSIALAIDSARTQAVADLITARLRVVPRGRDPASAYVARLLRCPSAILQLGRNGAGSADTASLDSRCNFK